MILVVHDEAIGNFRSEGHSTLATMVDDFEVGVNGLFKNIAEALSASLGTQKIVPMLPRQHYQSTLQSSRNEGMTEACVL